MTEHEGERAGPRSAIKLRGVGNHGVWICMGLWTGSLGGGGGGGEPSKGVEKKGEYHRAIKKNDRNLVPEVCKGNLPNRGREHK